MQVDKTEDTTKPNVGDVLGCPQDAPDFDYARLLKDCSDFKFSHLTNEQADAKPPAASQVI
jgi:hypothetical protein